MRESGRRTHALDGLCLLHEAFAQSSIVRRLRYCPFGRRYERYERPQEARTITFLDQVDPTRLILITRMLSLCIHWNRCGCGLCG